MLEGARAEDVEVEEADEQLEVALGGELLDQLRDAEEDLVSPVDGHQEVGQQEEVVNCLGYSRRAARRR